MSSRREHPSALDWARFLAGEGRWTLTPRVRRHLATCQACRRCAAEMAAERAPFEASALRRTELATLQARAGALERGGPRTPPAWSWALLCAIAAASITVAVIAVRPSPGPGPLAAKGANVFAIYVDRAVGAAALGPRCGPGDRLIARYRTDRAYLLVLERDGRGAVQVLLPLNGAASAHLAAPEGTTPASWVLDAVPGEECFGAFFSDEPIDAASASAAFASSPHAPRLPGADARIQCCQKGAAR